MNPDINNSAEETNPDQNSSGTAWQSYPPNDEQAMDKLEQEYASSDHKSNRGLKIILASCILGMLGVYLFGIYQKPQEASAKDKAIEEQIDLALAKFVNSNQKNPLHDVLGQTEEMVQIFYEYPSNQQVALDDLQKNPFSRITQEPGAQPDAGIKTRQQLENELKKKLEGFELQSVLPQSNGKSICQINGHIYRLGQKIAENTFEITTITNNSVTLKAGEFEFVLKI